MTAGTTAIPSWHSIVPLQFLAWLCLEECLLAELCCQHDGLVVSSLHRLHFTLDT